MSEDRKESDKVSDQNTPSTFSRCKDIALQTFYFFQLNGGYFALYGLMIPSILMNIFSAVFNEFSILIRFDYLDFREVAYFHIYRR